MYLISALTSLHAGIMAQENNLKHNEYVFIPYNANVRDKLLIGRRGIPKEKLIGDFTEEEIAMLTME